MVARFRWLGLFCLAGLACAAADRLPAFPGAEGAGAFTPGGRGGDVYRVTNLNDSGPGSLRYGIQNAKGPRTIVFDVSGTIVLASPLSVNKPYLTLAGQTAPGEGITVSGWTTSVSNTHDVIVRYMRFRAGDVNCPKMQGDTLDVDRSTDVILDHVSASWSIDEALSVTDADRTTVQWSFITESLNQSCHEKGEHGYGSLIRYGAGTLTFHHNLYAHNHSRNPRVGDNITLDFVNNVVYDYGLHGGEAGYSGAADEGTTRVNYVGNYVIAGPNTDASRRSRAFHGGSANTLVNQAGNLIDGNLNQIRDGVDTGWNMFVAPYTPQPARFGVPEVRTTGAAAAYRRVLDSAGSSLVRDAVDLRLVSEVEQDGGKVINSQNDVGGWPELKSGPAPKDTDGDGIPDAWELAYGLNPADPSDGPAITASGYSSLELYLNDLIAPGAGGSVIVDDAFADGDSQNQDLPGSLRVFNGRTNNIRTDQTGSVTFDVRPAGTSSEAFWAYFTDAGSPVVLGVGDKLSVSVTFSVSGFLANGADIRWGVLDSLGTRNTTNLSGGMNDSTFVGDPGYGLDFYASGAGNPFVLGRRTVLSSANVFNSFGDFATIPGSGAMSRQPLSDGTPYTLTYSIERLRQTETRLSATVTGGNLDGLTYSGVESAATPATSFDYFAFRIGGTSFASKIAFTRLLVEYLPAAPIIVSQPQPSSLTVQVGSNVTLAIAASGSSLEYRWRKDGQLITGNDSAAAPTLNLMNVQTSDAGAYTATVSNAGGTVTTRPVTLRVSVTPVLPAPAITSQPASVTVVLGGTATLTVAATGDGLLYQWFRNGSLIPGVAAASLTISNAQVSDSAAYAVVISNTSGSIASVAATVLVVSPGAFTGLYPYPGYTNACIDYQLGIEYDRPVKAGRSGRIRVFDAAGASVDAIDMAANPQTRVIGGVPFSYSPVIVSGNRALITLHGSLAYGQQYKVVVEPGVLLDADGAPVAGLDESDGWSFTTRSAGPAADASAITVGGGGQSDFCTVQGAIDFVPVNNTQPVTITVSPGTYNEIVYVPSSKPFITVRGVDRDATVIQYANNNSRNPSTVGRALFGVDAASFTLQDITVVNTTPKGGSQAEAFRGNNQRILLNRVTLKSYQDTLLLQGAGMVNDSYIEGDVDFMWGAGAVFIQNSELKGLSSGGYYTQIRNGKGQNGYVFLNSKLTGAGGVSGMYLSRIDPGVYPSSQVVFINCAMGPHIDPAGWMLNNATTAPDLRFWEYGSKTLEGAPLDVTRRAPFSRQLTAAEAAQWNDPAFVLGWSPVNLTAAATDSGVRVRWTGSQASAAWIGVYEPGSADSAPLARASITGASGTLELPIRTSEPSFEVRMFTGNGKRAATSNRVAVRR